MPREKVPRGTAFCVTIHADVYALVQRAAIACAGEGDAVGVRAMLDRAIIVGAHQVNRCAMCRAGKCSRHMAKTQEIQPTEHPSADESLPKNESLKPSGSQPRLDIVAQDKPMQTQFALLPDAPSVPSTPAKKPRKKREVTPDSPEYTRLIDVYKLEFVRVRNEKPAWTSRDFADFKSLLKAQGFDRACDLIKNAFADPFWSKRVTIRKIADDPSLFAGTNKVTSPSSAQRENDLPEGWA